MSRVFGLRLKRAAARQRRFITALAAALLGGSTVSCAPDQTSFFDLNASGETSRDGDRAAAPAPAYAAVAGTQDRGFATLPAGSLEAVSLSSAIDCVSALRVTQRTLSQQGGLFGSQAIDAIKQAETIFYERAKAHAGQQDETASDLSVAIEKKTQILLQSPSEAAQQALTCIRTLSENA